MKSITIFTEKRYYLSKYGEKQYLDGSSGDNVLIEAAILTGNGLRSEEHEIYTAYGETEIEAKKALDSYLLANPNHPQISKIEKS